MKAEYDCLMADYTDVKSWKTEWTMELKTAQEKVKCLESALATEEQERSTLLMSYVYICIRGQLTANLSNRNIKQ
jgi:hypothetical protein